MNMQKNGLRVGAVETLAVRAILLEGKIRELYPLTQIDEKILLVNILNKIEESRMQNGGRLDSKISEYEKIVEKIESGMKNAKKFGFPIVSKRAD